MSSQFTLLLGDQKIPVVNWINRHGSPEGRKLRFTVPVEAKAKLEANSKATFTLVRDDQKWDFELLSIGLATTGTNGFSATGQVRKKLPAHLKSKLRTLVEKSQASLEENSKGAVVERSGTGIGLPNLATTMAEAKSETGGPAAEVEAETEQAQPVEEPRRADEAEPPAVPETTPAEAEAEAAASDANGED